MSYFLWLQGRQGRCLYSGSCTDAGALCVPLSARHFRTGISSDQIHFSFFDHGNAFLPRDPCPFLCGTLDCKITYSTIRLDPDVVTLHSIVSILESSNESVLQKVVSNSDGYQLTDEFADFLSRSEMYLAMIP